MKTLPTTLGMAALFFIGGMHANASLLFSDSFEDDPGSPGTAELSGVAPVDWNRSSSTLIEILSDPTAPDGTRSVFFRDGTRTLTQKTATTITGGGDLLFTFDFKGSNSLESADGLTFRINFGQGGGYEDVLRDGSIPNGTADSTYSGTQITLDATDGSDTNWHSYAITVPQTYYSSLSATSFQMQFYTNGSSNNEDFHLDNVAVNTVVPEPSSFVLLFSGVLGFMLFCRNKTKK